MAYYGYTLRNICVNLSRWLKTNFGEPKDIVKNTTMPGLEIFYMYQIKISRDSYSVKNI